MRNANQIHSTRECLLLVCWWRLGEGFLISLPLSVLSLNRRTGCATTSLVLWIADLISLNKEVNLLFALFSLRFSVVAALRRLTQFYLNIFIIFLIFEFTSSCIYMNSVRL